MSSSRQNTLLAALRKTAAPLTAETTEKEAPPSRSVAPPAAPRIGKPVQFWMHEEDRKLIREFSAWLAGQEIRPSDSMIVRAALRTVKTGPAFLEAYRQAAARDGRLKPR